MHRPARRSWFLKSDRPFGPRPDDWLGYKIRNVFVLVNTKCIRSETSSPLPIPSEVHGAVALAGHGEVIDVGKLIQQPVPAGGQLGRRGGQQLLIALGSSQKKARTGAGWGRWVSLELAAQRLARHAVAIAIKVGALLYVEVDRFPGALENGSVILGMFILLS